MTAYLATAKVRHLAAWVADTPDPGETWRSGQHRAICGIYVPQPYRAFTFPEALTDTEGPHRAHTLKQLTRPVCKRCLEALEQLTALTYYVPPQE